MRADRYIRLQYFSLNPKKKTPHWRGLFIFDEATQTLISTSTPLGSSIFIKASTVLEELE